MMVVVAATTAAAGSNIRVLGELALVFLLLAIVSREILSSSTMGSALELRRGLTILIAPLSLAVAVVLFQQISVFFH